MVLQVINELKKSIQLLDSTTAVKPSISADNNQLLIVTKKKKTTKKETIEIEIESEELKKKKSTKPQRYVYLLDKSLEKILIRYIYYIKDS